VHGPLSAGPLKIFEKFSVFLDFSAFLSAIYPFK